MSDLTSHQSKLLQHAPFLADKRTREEVDMTPGTFHRATESLVAAGLLFKKQVKLPDYPQRWAYGLTEEGKKKLAA